MSETNVLKFIFLVGLIIIEAIRAPHRRRNRQERRQKLIVEQRIQGAELVVLYGGLLGLYILPAIYIFTPWLDFANYHLPAWAGLIGLLLMALSIWVLWRAHADLGRNWSPSLEIPEGQSLVTQGIYHYIRHPIYASVLLSGLAQALLLQNWLAGLSGLAVFLITYLLRVPREEQMMLETYGDAYRTYMNQTSGIIPRLQI
jgi:protein-S-isoprenylcysteine O-methyltransferase Ste14